MKISFSTFSVPKSGIAVVLAAEGGKLSDDGAEIDKAVGGAIGNAMKVADFKAEREKSLDVILPKGAGPERVIVMGVGKTAELDEAGVEYLGGAIAAAAGKVQATGLTVSAMLPGKSDMEAAAASARLASGIRLRSYSFTKYKSKPSKTKELSPTCENVDCFRCCRENPLRRAGCGCHRCPPGERSGERAGKHPSSGEFCQ